MAWSSWLTWPDAIYDYGTHLYNPWQISLGRHLYTDIAYFNGPFSEHFNAMLFLLFGVSIHVLMLVNSVIALLVLITVFALVGRLSGSEWVATAACLVFVILFAFSRYIGIGNYNWICPYTHEVTHGVAMSLAMVWTMDQFNRSGRLRWLATSSVLLGLIFLTKAEVFAPAAGAFVAAMLLHRRIKNQSRLLPQILWASMPFLAVLLAVGCAFAIYDSSSAACRALLGSWPWVFDHRIANLQFYRQGLGTDDVPANLRSMAFVGLMHLLGFAAVVAAGTLRKRWLGFQFVLFTAFSAVMIYFPRVLLEIARPWPILLAIVAVASAVQACNGTFETQRRQAALRSVMAVLALGMLGKMILNARIWQYGFTLALPAAVVLSEVFLSWVPATLGDRGHNAERAKITAGILLAGVIAGLYLHQIRGSANTVSVGHPVDRFISGNRGREVDLAIQAIEQSTSPDETVAVMPQGLMLNFLSRRAAPTAVVNVMPPEVLSIGEDQMATDLAAHPPRLIVLSEKDVDDNAFLFTEGRYHYGAKILAWVRARYRCLLPADNSSELRLSIWIQR